MDKEREFAGIADASEPNAGRVYDYLLGGSHNFEIDRNAAEQVMKVMPSITEIVRLIRWFMGEAVYRLSEEGYDKFLDFASGLPTVDHIHNIVPRGTKVIYSDIDPVTVAYAQDILGDNQDTRYLHCNAETPEELLNSEVIREMFGDEQRLAIGYNGIAWFIPDKKLDHAMSVLYDWADEGSKLFICDVDQEKELENVGQMRNLYKQMGQPVYSRTRSEARDLMKPWRVEDPGFMPLEDWLSMEQRVHQETMEKFGSNLYGGILIK